MFSREISYSVPDASGRIGETTFVFFGSRDEEFCSNLARHAKDHFLKGRWVRLLNLEEKIDSLRQKANGVGVTSERGLAEALWPVLGPALDAGIRWSLNMPVFLRYVQDREAGGRRVEAGATGFFFLASEGFIVFVHQSRVRSALFQSDHPERSREAVFSAAWEYLRRKWQDHQRATGNGKALLTSDSKHGQTSVYHSLEAISAANWRKRPNI